MNYFLKYYKKFVNQIGIIILLLQKLECEIKIDFLVEPKIPINVIHESCCVSNVKGFEWA